MDVDNDPNWTNEAIMERVRAARCLLSQTHLGDGEDGADREVRAFMSIFHPNRDAQEIVRDVRQERKRRRPEAAHA